jgi:hypothetical protein
MGARLLLVAVTLLVAACGLDDAPRGGAGDPSTLEVEAPVGVPEPTPLAFPCEADLRSGEDGVYVPGNGGVIGCVTDAEGSPIPEAGIIVLDLPFGVTIPDIGSGTTETGRYVYGELHEPGWYRLQASAHGYESLARSVRVEEGKIAVVDFVLERDGETTDGTG